MLCNSTNSMCILFEGREVIGKFWDIYLFTDSCEVESEQAKRSSSERFRKYADGMVSTFGAHANKFIYIFRQKSK